jgi:hypothetical protein
MKSYYLLIAIDQTFLGSHTEQRMKESIGVAIHVTIALLSPYLSALANFQGPA